MQKTAIISVLLVVLGCNDVRSGFIEEVDNELERSKKRIEQNLEKIEDQKRRVEELEKSWREEDSISQLQ